jgi:hypothetical protein
MAPIAQRILRTVPPIEHDAAGDHAHVETEEHEVIEFDGCSEAEVKAKLHDYLAWAS